MISSDDVSPPDPQKCLNDFKINSDEIIDHASVSESDLDLFKSLVADLGDTNNSIPRFSIRDYVSNSRSKDIACNWPFPHKTLQICLQHGVKNLLPPFQSLESIKDNSSVENRPSDEEIVTSSDGKPMVDEFLSSKSNLKLTFESLKTTSSRSKGDKESQVHLQKDFSHTKSKKTVLSSRKIVNATIQTAIKKCRLKEKLNTSVEQIEEVTLNNFIVSETMASKICPVCKTFSSSSNTTLNAHIDQCLSGESNMKWTANPKVAVKHRIKPRKTRLMVDVYKTAPRCTVEELDARNGTSWANNSSFPAQELEFQGEQQEKKEEKREGKIEEKKERKITSVVPEVADREGAVYIDTDGTKVRILSVPKVDMLDDHGARKLTKGGKLRKCFIEKKKKKNHEQKHQQINLKPSPNSKKLRSLKPNCGAVSEVTTGKEEKKGKEPMNSEVRTKMDDLPIIRPPWACSKRTGIAKKIRRNFQNVASDTSFSECDLRTSSSSSKKSESSLPQNNRKMKFSPIGHFSKKRSSMLSKPSSKHLKKKEGTVLSDSCKDPSDICVSKGSKGSKLNLKRKFSAIKRSRDFSKQKLRLEEEEEEETSGKTSSESMNMNLLEIGKKNEMEICRKENSGASRSSNGDSSTWMKNDVAFPLCDVQSVGKEIDAPESSMGLSNSLNLESPKLLSQPDNNDKEMYSADEAEKAMRIDDGVTDDIEKQQNYFPVPIIIPEPPGLLILPVSEELGVNSSFADITRVQLSEDQHHHDMMDRDSMSDSPISTISNPSLARSDSDKFSVRSASLKDEHTRGFTGAMVDPKNEKYTPITSANSSDWRSPHPFFAEKGPIASFKKDQPCCCSRKEGASSYNHESAFLRKHTADSLNFRPQTFSISSYPISQAPPPRAPETMASPPTMKIPAYSDCDSVGSPSKPVLRLMGKNLTVVKTDEDESSMSQQFRPPPQINPMPRFSNVQNEYQFSSVGYHPTIYNQNQNGVESQYPMFQQPTNSRSNHALDTMFRNTTYVDNYSHGSPMIQSDMNRFDGQMASGSNVRKTTLNPSKEVIVIDGSPEDEGNEAMHTRRNWASLSSSIPGYQSQSSLRFNNGSLQTCSPFMVVGDNGNYAKWNCTQAGSSRSVSPSTPHMRSSAIYHPPNFL